MKPGFRTPNTTAQDKCASPPAGLFSLAAIAGVLALTACATTPPPSAALQAAEQAIGNADRARVTDTASPELAEARQKLNAARSAAQNEDMVLARQLAEQSRVSAELASARAEALRAKTVNDDMRKGNETLQQEIQRNTGARQ